MNTQNYRYVNLEGMKANVGEDNTQAYLSIVLEEAPSFMQELNLRISNNQDMTSIAQQAHLLKGTVCYLETTECTQVFASLEKAAKSGDSLSVHRLSHAANSVFNEMTDEIQDILAHQLAA